MKGHKSLTEAEVKDLALRIFRGEVFTSSQVRKEDWELLRIIFMPLGMMEDKDIARLSKQGAVLLYADMEEAMPRSINGYPIFPSFSWINKEDAEKVTQKFKQNEKATEEV